MGTSYPEGKPFIASRIMASGARRILDVGAGSGTWARELRRAGFEGVIDGVEVWQPYIDTFRLLEVYDDVYEQDVREWKRRHFDGYDVVIFGDVLEHMPEGDAVRTWTRAGIAPYRALSLPVVPYPQGALNGNPYEVHHVTDWTVDRVLRTFTGITEHERHAIEGVFWADASDARRRA